MASKMVFFFMINVITMVMAVQTANATIIEINGRVSCSLNGIDIANVPPFPNAAVQLECSGSENVLASTTTDTLGLFLMQVNPLAVSPTNLLSSCDLVVPTPLASCNPSLPSTGFLSSPLQILKSGLGSDPNLPVHVEPAGFKYSSS